MIELFYFVYWPRLDFDIADLARRCDHCVEASKSGDKRALQLAQRKATVDLRASRFTRSVSGRHLICADAYPKRPEVVETPTNTSTSTIRDLNKIFSRFVYPNRLVTDNGSQLRSGPFRTFCE